MDSQKFGGSTWNHLDLPFNFSCRDDIARESRSPFSSGGLLEDRANGVWQDGSHRRRAEADNAKLVLEDRGSDTTTPLNWNLKSIRGAPHPLTARGEGGKKKEEKREDWYPGKSNWKITVAKIDWRRYYRRCSVDEHRDSSKEDADAPRDPDKWHEGKRAIYRY